MAAESLAGAFTWRNNQVAPRMLGFKVTLSLLVLIILTKQRDLAPKDQPVISKWAITQIHIDNIVGAEAVVDAEVVLEHGDDHGGGGGALPT